MKRFRVLSIAFTLTLLLAGTVTRAQMSGSVAALTPCNMQAVLNSDTAAGATQLVAAPVGSGFVTFPNGDSGTAAVAGNIAGPRIHICSFEVQIVQGSTAANYGLISSPGTGVVSGTYTSGGTIVGSSTQTCNVTFSNNGIVNGTATVALTGTNTIAGSTALTITSSGYGATSAPTQATLSSGTAACSGTATVATTISPCAAPGGATNATLLTPLWIGAASTTQSLHMAYNSDGAIWAPQTSAVCAYLSSAPTGSQFVVNYAVY